MVNDLKGLKIVGIKKTPSKDGKKTYTTYYGLRPWSDYELKTEEENANASLEGAAVEEVNTTEDFPISVGDVVKFFYARATQYGDKVYQPVDDYKLITPATPFDKDKAAK